MRWRKLTSLASFGQTLGLAADEPGSLCCVSQTCLETFGTLDAIDNVALSPQHGIDSKGKGFGPPHFCQPDL